MRSGEEYKGQVWEDSGYSHLLADLEVAADLSATVHWGEIEFKQKAHNVFLLEGIRIFQPV